ncbi:zinc-dependent alcohol dehydrogenase family protein [Streptomyces sp. NPDC091215]|uniref:zinc-dependent alcohol dehydrogenase family protein n=1 Tax=Streptomyces sp. NPDC091215 TaxID=3155192 RepID=UPI00342B5007
MTKFSTRTVLFDQTGGPEVLRIEALEPPVAGRGEVLIRVEAVGLSRADVLFRSGMFYEQPTFPGSRLGLEAAGVVEAVGEDVTEFAVGDPVFTGPGIQISAQGVFADRVALPVAAVIARPDTVDATTAAAAWFNYSTAYGGLLESGGLRSGDHVLITAASGGVGSAAIQIARRTGAVPIAVTRTEDKRRLLLEAGAAEVIVSETQDVVEEARRITGGKGVELVFDAVGGPGLADVAKAAALGGTVVAYGFLDTRPMLMPVNWPLTVRGHANTVLNSTPEGRRRVNRFLAAGLGDGSLRPVISKVFKGLDRIQDAFRELESNTASGKIVVTL